MRIGARLTLDIRLTLTHVRVTMPNFIVTDLNMDINIYKYLYKKSER